jgi:hypothetical protein
MDRKRNQEQGEKSGNFRQEIYDSLTNFSLFHEMGAAAVAIELETRRYREGFAAGLLMMLAIGAEIFLLHVVCALWCGNKNAKRLWQMVKQLFHVPDAIGERHGDPV